MESHEVFVNLTLRSLNCRIAEFLVLKSFLLLFCFSHLVRVVSADHPPWWRRLPDNMEAVISGPSVLWQRGWDALWWRAGGLIWGKACLLNKFRWLIVSEEVTVGSWKQETAAADQAEMNITFILIGLPLWTPHPPLPTSLCFSHHPSCAITFTRLSWIQAAKDVTLPSNVVN